jgi:uncharacterized protein (DUF1778 family)
MVQLRLQLYVTEEQRTRLEQRAAAEQKTVAQVVREAVDQHLADPADDEERQRILDETFGNCPGIGSLMPSRDEWERNVS